MPKVSIIMPTYNVEKYFRQCIESVINQTLQDIEIIPVDNGSPDNCGMLMDEYASKDSRIKPIHQDNKGYAGAVNNGIKRATGEYIGIVETDDWVEPEMFETLYFQAKNLDVDIIKSGYNRIIDNKLDKILNVNLEISEQEIFTIDKHPEIFTMHPSIWSCLYKREFLTSNNIYIDEDLPGSWVDNSFQVLSMLKANKICYLNKAFYNYRYENVNSSSSLKKDLEKPYRTSLRVHKVVEENTSNKLIIEHIAIREWNYIKDIISKTPYDKKDEAREIIKKMFDLIGDNLSENGKFQSYKRRHYDKDLSIKIRLRDFKNKFKNRRK